MLCTSAVYCVYGSFLHNSTSTMRLLVLVIMYNLPCYLLQFTFCSISQPKLWTIKLITPRLRAAECQASDRGQVAHSGMEGDSNLHFSPASWQWVASFQSCWSWKEFLHNAMSLCSLQSRFAQKFVEANVPSWQQSYFMVVTFHMMFNYCQPHFACKMPVCTGAAN